MSAVPGVSAVPMFSSYLNNNPFNLRFVESDYGNTITFLDLKLEGTPGQLIQSETYRKKIAGNTILHFNSQHPKHTLKAIPVGVLTHAKQNISSRQAFEKESNRICHSLKAWGYPDAVLQRAEGIVNNKIQDNLLSVKCDEGSIDSRPILVLDYNN